MVKQNFVITETDVSVVDQDSAASGHVNCSVNHPTVFTLQRLRRVEVTSMTLDRRSKVMTLTLVIAIVFTLIVLFEE